MKRLAELGETMENFCETVGIKRSVIYTWLGRGDRLEDNKPLAKSYPTKVNEVKRAEVVVKYTDNHGIMGAWEVAQHVGGISASKTAEIIRSIKPYILAYNKKLMESFRKNSYEFLKVHVCWSWDYMNVCVGQERLQLHTLMDESSRYILGWLLTAGVNFAQFTGMIKRAVNKYGVTPLVLKHDNDIVLRGVEEFLVGLKIVDLPGPTYYPRYNAHLERGNADLRKQFSLYEENSCLTYSEMNSKIGLTVDYLRNIRPRDIFDGKTCADIFKNSAPITEISPEELICRIKNREQEWQEVFAGKKGLKKMHRYAVIEELKAVKLLTVKMEHWQDYLPKSLV